MILHSKEYPVRVKEIHERSSSYAGTINHRSNEGQEMIANMRKICKDGGYGQKKRIVLAGRFGPSTTKKVREAYKQSMPLWRNGPQWIRLADADHVDVYIYNRF